MLIEVYSNYFSGSSLGIMGLRWQLYPWISTRLYILAKDLHRACQMALTWTLFCPFPPRLSPSSGPPSLMMAASTGFGLECPKWIGIQPRCFSFTTPKLMQL